MQQDEMPNNIVTEQDKEKTLSPPYVSFLTFTNFVAWLEDEGIPLRFDRSFWQKKFSGSTGIQLMAGLRFLGLLKGDVPQPELEALVEAKGDERRALLASIFCNAYEMVDFDSLRRATPAMLTEWFRAYGLDGDTLRKAESFFINGCKTVDVPLSNALKKKARNKPSKSTVGVPKERKSVKARDRTPHEPPKPPPSLRQDREQVNKVALASGGEVTLSLNVDLFQLSKEDRDFVLNLVDTMKTYADASENQ